MSFKKIDKEFLYTDSTVNCYSYKLLTSGYLIDLFKKNPIGYRMHKRADGVAVRWTDFRIDGDKVFAKPIVNLSHPLGKQTAEEIENGFLNAASVGRIIALEISSDPKDYEPGQKGPTVSKWYNQELSIVDIPGNDNALAELYDANEQLIDLSNFSIQNINMKQIFLTPAQVTQIPNLKADAEQADVDKAFSDLIAKAGKVDGLTNDLAAANTAKKTAEDALEAFKKTTTETKVSDLVGAAVNDKKITVETANKLKVAYKENADGLKDLLDSMTPAASIADALNKGTETNNQELKDLMAMNGQDLWEKGKFERLKELSEPTYKIKYKEFFGADPS